MRIVLVSSEAVPFAKTGGLADVVTGLARALYRAGHDVTIILPDHRQFVPSSLTGESTGVALSVWLNDQKVQAWIRKTHLPDSRISVLLIDHPGYFDRQGLYGEGGHDYPDNAERYLFFSRAALEAIAQLDLHPDIIHANDWQTGVIPAVLHEEYSHQPGFERTATVFTIHNMAFQGMFPAEVMRLTNLPSQFFNWQQMEFHGKVNLLKTGISFAHRVTTVSPTYAREITTPEYGYGLEGALSARGEDLVGILNGVDTSEWNPNADHHLPQRYEARSVGRGKPICRAELLHEMKLPRRTEGMLCGMVSRMTDQKGFDLILPAMESLLATGSSFVFLGNGDPVVERKLKNLGEAFPEQFAVRIGYDERLAHRIEAGIDLFLMPSRFEPCGLNQMYSLLYGSPPLVHRVGGLADSVVDTNPETLAAGTANGFAFSDYNVESFIETFHRALATWRDRPTWEKIVQNGMIPDISWNRSASLYAGLYERAIASRCQSNS
ncbi:MAG: glycogen synthase GlgA [Planctomycetaceae bacterium]